MILSMDQLRRDYKIYRKKDQEIAARIDILISYTKYELKYDGDVNKDAKKKHINAFLTSMEISDRTIQRFKKDYREKGADGLGKLKATGRPPVAIRRRIRLVIAAYRKMYRWGSEVIQAHLKIDHCYTVSRFKIEKFLDDSGLRDQYPCTTIKRQKAQKKKKHTKKVKVDNPGDHTQIDVKHQPHLLGNNSKCYVYNIVDHASNWSFKRAYEAYNARNTKDFMERLLKECPFILSRLQSDNGVEFTYKYISVSDDPKEHPLTTFCNENNITHKLVPPGEKELQGLVERSHRQDDQELYSRISPQDLAEFNDKLSMFCHWRNNNRRFKKLGWLTPNEWLNRYTVIALALKFLYQEKTDRRSFSLVSSELKEVDKKINLVEDDFTQDSAKEIKNNDVRYRKLAA
jgi:hypothetical protein